MVGHAAAIARPHDWRVREGKRQFPSSRRCCLMSLAIHRTSGPILCLVPQQPLSGLLLPTRCVSEEETSKEELGKAEKGVRNCVGNSDRVRCFESRSGSPQLDGEHARAPRAEPW